MNETQRMLKTVGLALAGFTFASQTRAQDAAEPAVTPQGPPPSYTPGPPPPKPPAFTGSTPAAREARAPVRFEPSDPSVQLLTLSGETSFAEIGYVHHGWWRPHGYYYGYGVAPVYTPLCDGPCTLQLMPGPYHWALSQPGGPLVPAAGPSLIHGPSTLNAEYIDRRGLRTAGAIVGVVGVVGGIIMIAEAYHDHCDYDAYGDCYYRHADVNGPLVAGGIGVLVGSAIVAAVLMSQRDEARISVTPLHVANRKSPGDVGFIPVTLRTQPEGAAVSLSF